MIMLTNCLLSWLKHRRDCSGDFPTRQRRQVSLVEEARDKVVYHNTWCSRTSCGGINTYTLTARLGPGDLAHYEIARSLIQLPGVSCKETRRGDQAGF